eukprot:m.28064 g.28064  ORF g.28064 m.28064 type:complete len:270 (-) comp6012_c0_seq2:316-1125(-)
MMKKMVTKVSASKSGSSEEARKFPDNLLTNPSDLLSTIDETIATSDSEGDGCKMGTDEPLTSSSLSFIGKKEAIVKELLDLLEANIHEFQVDNDKAEKELIDIWKRVENVVERESAISKATLRTPKIDETLKEFISVKNVAKTQHDGLPFVERKVKLCEHVCLKTKQESADVISIIQSHLSQLKQMQEKMNTTSAQDVWWATLKPVLFKSLSLVLGALLIVITLVMSITKFIIRQRKVVSLGLVSVLIVLIGIIVKGFFSAQQKQDVIQ